MLKKIALALALAGAPALAVAATPAFAAETTQAQTTTAQYTVTGMHCSHCGAKVKAALKKVDGVKTVEVDLDKKSVTVTYDGAKTTTGAIQKAIEGTGFKVAPSA